MNNYNMIWTNIIKNGLKVSNIIQNGLQVVPGRTHIFVRNYMETILRDLLEMQELTDIISYVILMHMKKSVYYLVMMASEVGGCPLPSNSTTEALVLLGAAIDSIGCWIKSLEKHVLECCHIYLFNMNKLYQKISVEITKQPSPKKKQKSLLHAIEGGWYVNKLGKKLPPLKKKRLNKISQKEED